MIVKKTRRNPYRAEATTPQARVKVIQSRTKDETTIQVVPLYGYDLRIEFDAHIGYATIVIHKRGE